LSQWRYGSTILDLSLTPTPLYPSLGKEPPITKTIFMELIPSPEAASCAPTQELPSILCHPKIHKIPSLVFVLSQINLFHTTPSYLFIIYLNIILHLQLGLPSGSFLLAFISSPI
jgi:hypothetical protein